MIWACVNAECHLLYLLFRLFPWVVFWQMPVLDFKRNYEWNMGHLFYSEFVLPCKNTVFIMLHI